MKDLKPFDLEKLKSRIKKEIEFKEKYTSPSHTATVWNDATICAYENVLYMIESNEQKN